jgi:glycosyltransferase involved in cell wall biosynthesis
VSVFLAVRNEEPYLREAVTRILDQDYPGSFEVVLAVGPSDDATRAVADQLAADDARVTVVDNPTGLTPQGLNLAWRAAQHPYLVRVDGHSLLPDGYIATAVDVLRRTGAANVGGMMLPQGVTPFQQAVARAMSSRLGIGSEKFHTGGEAGPADTVYLGAYRRADLEEVGGFNEEFTRAQDWELNHRLIGAGKVVWFDPALSVGYRPRGSWKALVKQFFTTGQWRSKVIETYPETASTRYFAPPAAVTVVGLGGVIGLLGLLFGRRALRAFFAVPGLYAAGVTVGGLAAGKGLPLKAKAWLPAVIATMHMAWGAGFIKGVPGKTRPWHR